jgi:hypothetical protein
MRPLILLRPAPRRDRRRPPSWSLEANGIRPVSLFVNVGFRALNTGKIVSNASPHYFVC